MDGFVVENKKYEDKIYAQKGFKSFLYRYTDSGFRTKWCGLWVPPIKILDYYAYKVNGQWLDIKNQSRFVLEKERGVHEYNLKDTGIKVSETVFVPLDKKSMISVLEVKNSTEADKKVTVFLEAAVNIRTKNENWHTRGYKVQFNHVRRSVDIDAEDIIGHVRIGMGKTDDVSFDFTRNDVYKDHYPGEKERCFIPGRIEVKINLKAAQSKKIPFIFSGSEISPEDLSKNYDESIHNWEKMIEDKSMLLSKLFTSERIETPDKKLNAAFSWSSVNLVSLLHTGTYDFGLFAGVPWFLRFWGRDTLWSVFGLVDVGEFDAAKECILNIAHRYDKKIATVVDLEGNCEYYSDDTDPLFLLALDYYIKNTGDTDFEAEIKEVCDSIRKNLKTDEKGLVITNSKGSWMDSYDRYGTPIEVQSLWIDALKDKDSKRSGVLKKAMDSVFWNKLENFPRDTATDDSMTVNCVVPVMLDQFSKSHSTITLNRIGEEFMTKYGVRTRSPFSHEYGSSEYHKGASWGLTTGLTAAASFAHGMTDEGLACVKSMAYEVGDNQVSAMAECVDADTGRNLGATMQAWSHALYIHAIDRYMFGIDVDLKKGVINFCPQIPVKWKSVARFGKKIGYYSMNLRIDKDKTKIEMKIVFTSEPKVKGSVKFPYVVKRIVANGKTVNDKTCEFDLMKENTIVGFF